MNPIKHTKETEYERVTWAEHVQFRVHQNIKRNSEMLFISSKLDAIYKQEKVRNAQE